MPNQKVAMVNPRIIEFVTVVITLLLMPLAAHAQPAAKVPRIGLIFGNNPAASAPLYEAFKQGLQEHGYVEGQSVVVERRYGEGRTERLAEVAAELVRMKVDVIVAGTDQAIAAVKRQTRTIPIVMVVSTDPVGTGFVASLARPAGNITGLSTMSPELGGKRLEILKEAIPELSRVAVIWNPDVRGNLLDYKQLEEPARALRLQLQSLEVSHAADLAPAFTAIASARSQAVIVITPNPVVRVNQVQLVSLAQKNRLPSMYGIQEYVDGGGLMAYGIRSTALFRRAATYVDKIMKGAKPGDLPIEQPTKFELVINLRTAKAIGLTIPQSLLQRADHVIQ